MRTRCRLLHAKVFAMGADAPCPLTGALDYNDADLTHMAQAALGWYRSLPAGAINAQVQAGWLTLSGEVPWHYQRQDAQECVRHLPGLAGIHNHITLRPAAPCGGPAA